MRKKFLLLSLAALAFSLAGKARAGETFQFAPPPFPVLNLRSVDIEKNSGFDYIGMKVGGFKFNAVNFGGSRAIKYWDRGGFSLGGNIMLILGTGQFSPGSKMTMFGEGFGVQPNWYFDLKGDEEDDFSLPIYFGPHVNLNMLMGSASQYIPYYGTVTTYLTATTIMYGWQAGIQAGVNLNDYIKFVPYVDFSQEIGGAVATSITSSGYSSSTSVSIKSMPVTMSPGFDFKLRKVNLSLGGAIQNSKSATGTGEKTKTTVFHIRFQTKFRSICGI
ncbi:MAG: hypothetical protein PHV36_11935 [Elusimicrobiales bacterium]|nr:hypothetical protein [Elusimicrobiales bacterium]